MERLTEKISEYIQCNNNECRLSYCDRECEHYKRMVNKLAEYEDAEEQGLLLRLPCKIGSEVYRINKYDESIKLYTVESFDITKQQIFIHLERNIGTLCIEISDFGKTVFLTKEEAKAYNEVKTNADRVRSMTDEELAEMFTKLAWNSEVQTTPLKYLDWLKAERER